MERNIIKIDEAGLKDDLKTLIRGTVEDTLNAMLDEDVANLCNAGGTSASRSAETTAAGTTTGISPCRLSMTHKETYKSR